MKALRAFLLFTALLAVGGCDTKYVSIRLGPQPLAPVTRYAGPAGGGSAPCTTDAAPYCNMETALTQLICGDTLIIKNGTYQGASQMLNPQLYGAVLACSAGARMTVRAETDGGVVFDGQYVRQPVRFYAVSYWDMSGFNARYGATDAGGVVDVRGNSHHLTFKRIVAWDAGDANDQVLLGYVSDNILWEDIGAFGSANQICMADYISTNVTMRRVWCRGEGSTAGRHVTVNQFNYYGNGVNPNPALIENTIQTNAPASALRNATVGPDTGQIEWLTDINRDDALNPGVRYFGGLHYLMSEVHIVASPTTKILANGYKGDENCTGYDIRDTIFHANGFPTQPLSLVPGVHNGCHDGSPGQIESMNRVTTTTAGGSASGTGNATLTNFVEASTLGGTGFNYMGASGTARLCYQTIDGVLQDGTGGTTQKPLWPWPMDDRIKAAIASNTTANGAHFASSQPLSGSAGTGYAANTVTSEIAAVFGTIPSQCLGSGSTYVPPFPEVTDFPSTGLIDNFDRSPGAIGSNWTSVNDAPFTIAGNFAAAPASGPVSARMLWNASSFASGHEAYGIFPTMPTGDAVVLIFGSPSLTDSGYHLILMKSSGNDQLMVARLIGGYTPIVGPVGLGTDVSGNQSFGVRVTSAKVINVYWKYGTKWYIIGSVSDALFMPDPAYIGMGGYSPETINDFGGGSLVGSPNAPTLLRILGFLRR